ncbi:MAG: hypothetical protein H0T84_05235 [Tatlockia sp.]|nr:hypothetical protein [Tatlockia sp.]
MVYEYCNNVPFNPTPEFNAKPLTNSQFYIDANRRKDWFQPKSTLGYAFAICKGDKKGAHCYIFTSFTINEAQSFCEQVRYDLKALQMLQNQRTFDSIELKTKLSELLRECQTINIEVECTI